MSASPRSFVRHRSFAQHPLQLVLGLTVWAIWFVALYGGLSVACKLAPPPASAGALTWLNGALLLFTLATAALLGYWARLCWRAQGFIARVGAGVHLASAVATLAMGLPALVLPPCV